MLIKLNSELILLPLQPCEYQFIRFCRLELRHSMPCMSNGGKRETVTLLYVPNDLPI